MSARDDEVQAFAGGYYCAFCGQPMEVGADFTVRDGKPVKLNFRCVTYDCPQWGKIFEPEIAKFKVVEVLKRT